jgi:hypothetical protein
MWYYAFALACLAGFLLHRGIDALRWDRRGRGLAYSACGLAALAVAGVFFADGLANPAVRNLSMLKPAPDPQWDCSPTNGRNGSGGPICIKKRAAQ